MRIFLNRLLALLTLSSSILMSSSAHASAHIGFRWGGPIDDGKLLALGEKIAPDHYRLNEAILRDTLEFLESQGWSHRSSGAGIYYSSDLTDSFGDGRLELFIFDISDSIQIAKGGLGDLVRNYYFAQGPTPPMISRYTQTWHVIARAPSDEEFNCGEKILFHPATPQDAMKVYQQIIASDNETQDKLNQNLERFRSRLSYEAYGCHVAQNTRAFIAAIEAICENVEATRANALALKNQIQSMNCAD